MKDLKNRLKENFSKNRYVIIGLFVAWIAIVGFTLYSYRDTLGKQSSGNEFYDNYVELTSGTSICETVPVEEGADTVAVKMATYARKNSGNINITVTGAKSGKVYADKTINVKNVLDNTFVTVALDEELSERKDKDIKVELSSDCEEGKGLGIYYSTIKVFENSELKINNEIQEGDLTLRFLVKDDELALFYRIVIIWVIVTFTVIIFLLLVAEPKYEILFTVIAIAFGLTFWLIITPMSAPDETVHYEYSFQLSNYMMGEKNHLVFNEEYQNYGSFAGHFNVSAAYKRFIEKINKPLKLRDTNVVMRFDILEAYKTCFVPQALGITLARLLNWNMLRTFYMGRLFNLIFYIICVYIAIKKAPVHKMLFGILATLPIFMQQAASYSYDTFINGLTFVIIAFMLKWMYQEERISVKEFIFVFIVNLLIAPIKVVYSLFHFLFWFVPEERWGSKRNRIIGTLIITAPAMFELCRLLFPLIFRVVRKIIENIIESFEEARDNTGVYLAGMHTPVFDKFITNHVTPHFDEGEVYTFSYVMAHPLEMLELFLRTVRYSIKTWFYGSIGRALSGNSLILPTSLVHGLLALLIMSALREEDHVEPVWFKILSVVLCIFAGFMMVGGMLISWTEVEQVVIEDYGGPIIQGIQGRYFSPLLPYLFIVLHNNKIKLPKFIDKYVIYSFVVIVFEVVVYVLSYTFVN